MKFIFSVLSFLVIVSNYVSAQTFSLPSYKSMKELNNKYIVLGNGLRVQIISNPNARVSAVSITVGAGQRQSPRTLPGLPHLLEHTVFLNNAATKNNITWDEFINSSSGWSNGSTRSTNTRYHFQVKHDGLKEGLERFTTMLFNNNFSPEAIEVSLSEVDNEFQSGLGNDWNSILSVIRENTAPNSSARTFGIGNKASLNQPIKSIQNELSKFHQMHYSPENMTLAIYSHLPVEAIEYLVSTIFKLIKRGMASKRQFNAELHTDDQLGKIITMRSKNGRPSLDIRFEIPVHHLYNNLHTSTHLAELLGHETRGSILHLLKKEDLADNLSIAYQGDDINQVLDIYIELTKSGGENVERVINAVFTYIEFIKNNQHPNYIQQEILTVSKDKYKSEINIEPGDLVSNISDKMQYLTADRIFDYEYQDTPITSHNIIKYLEYFTKQNAQVFFSAENLPKGLINKSTHYKKEYTVSPLLVNDASEDLIKKFSFPIPNKYLSDRQTKKTVKKIPAFATLNKNSLSEKSVLIAIDSQVDENNNGFAFNALLSSHFKRSLKDDNYFATVAGLSISTTANWDNSTIEIEGAKAQLAPLAYDIFSKTVNSQLTELEFKAVKSAAYRKYEDHLYEKQYEQALYNNSLIASGLPSVTETLKEIESTDLATYNKFLVTLPKDVLIIASDDLLNNQFSKFFDIRKLINKNDKNANETGKKIVTSSPNNNAVVYPLIAAEKNIKAEAGLYVLQEFLSQKFRKFMREDKKVAYIAGTKISLRPFPVLNLIVESGNANSEELINLTKDFIKQEKANLAKLSQSEFNIIKARTLSRISESSSTKEELRTILQQIQRGYLEEDYRDVIAIEVNKLTLKDLEKQI
jgi:insulysin